MRKLYAISAPCPDLRQRTEALVAHGVAMFQYRDKTAAQGADAGLATELAAHCLAHGVDFVVNDDLTLARQLSRECRGRGRLGIHVGEHDAPVARCAAQLAPAQHWLGVSCHGSAARATQAVAAGANYVSFGRIFASRTKPDAPGLSRTALAEAIAAFRDKHPRLPVCVIGGLHSANIGDLLHLDVQIYAVGGALFHVPLDAMRREADALLGLLAAH